MFNFLKHKLRNILNDLNFFWCVMIMMMMITTMAVDNCWNICTSFDRDRIQLSIPPLLLTNGVHSQHTRSFRQHENDQNPPVFLPQRVEFSRFSQHFLNCNHAQYLMYFHRRRNQSHPRIARASCNFFFKIFFLCICVG